MLTGYIDESFDRNVFSLTCAFAAGGTWWWLENDWLRIIERKNLELSAAGRHTISRFYASDCSTRNGEFRGWSLDERDEFLKQLLDAIGKQPINVVGYSLTIPVLTEVVPAALKRPAVFCYSIMVKYALLDLGAFIDSTQARDTKISLFHERCDHDAVLLQSYESMLGRRDFEHAKRFRRLESVGWEDCVPLQPTDLFAYENFKESERRFAGRTRRRSLEAILELSQFGGRLMNLDRETLIRLKPNLDQFKLDKGIVDIVEPREDTAT